MTNARQKWGSIWHRITSTMKRTTAAAAVGGCGNDRDTKILSTKDNIWMTLLLSFAACHTCKQTQRTFRDSCRFFFFVRDSTFFEHFILYALHLFLFFVILNILIFYLCNEIILSFVHDRLINFCFISQCLLNCPRHNDCYLNAFKHSFAANEKKKKRIADKIAIREKWMNEKIR